MLQPAEIPSVISKNSPRYTRSPERHDSPPRNHPELNSGIIDCGQPTITHCTFESKRPPSSIDDHNPDPLVVFALKQSQESIRPTTQIIIKATPNLPLPFHSTTSTPRSFHPFPLNHVRTPRSFHSFPLNHAHTPRSFHPFPLNHEYYHRHPSSSTALTPPSLLDLIPSPLQPQPCTIDPKSYIGG
jgi:hypothetical protein